MKASSIDLREKIVAAHLDRHHSIRTVARVFTVSKSFVQKLVKQQKLASPSAMARCCHIDG